MKIAISCDENPGDPGAVHSGIVERDLNIRVANELVAALRRCGHEVWFDTSITYVQRVDRANAGNFDLLVACAHNASGSADAEGTQLLICNGGDDLYNQLAIAHVVGRHLVADGIAQRYGIVHEDVYECCAFNKTSVYIEFLFETNARDVARMKQPGYPHDAAESACRGLGEAMGFRYVPIPAPTPAPTPTPTPTPTPAPTPAPKPLPKTFLFQFRPTPPDDAHPQDQTMTFEDAIKAAEEYVAAHPTSLCDVVVTIAHIM